MANNQQLLMGEGAGGAPVVYVEDVFSTYLYTGNGTTQTITNNIDLSTKGGLVWIKSRTTTFYHNLVDTVRGVNNRLFTPTTDAQISTANSLTAFNTNGFSLGTAGGLNVSADLNVSWTFRKQPKFFDVVTWTGVNSPSSRLISHNLGSQPGHIMIKRTDAAGNWSNWHIAGSVYREFTPGINSTAALNSSPTATNVATSTSIDVWYTQQTSGIGDVNGATYVAYLFAHDAGGFGLAGTDNVISCGSYTGNGAVGGQLINLGYEVQWVMIKQTNSSGGWWMMDVMRGYTVNGDYGGDANLYADTAGAESSQVLGQPSALGFTPIQDNVNQSGQSYIYIAIRRDPMKVPTVGTSVYNSVLQSPQLAGTVRTVGFPADLVIGNIRNGSGHYFQDRLRGFPSSGTTQNTSSMQSQSTSAETSSYPYLYNVWNTTALDGDLAYLTNGVGWTFKRAPGFFDEVCYTGTGSATTFTHNLAAVPEMMIVKWRTGDAGEYWYVYHASLGVNSAINLNLSDPSSAFSITNGVAPTSSVFTISGGGRNTASATYVNYLFATCAGVSKVGGYTGNGSSQTIACGFTAGSRFVLIKRTDSTGDWYVWDSARGIVAGNDPYLLLNSTAAEVTTDDSVDTDNSGFIVNQVSATNINVTSATYIFLAIA